MSILLPFHISIIDKLCDPSNNDLLLIARGLGLQRIICKLLQIYDSPRNLVLLVNATAGEENGIGEELSILGCRKPGLRIVGYEMGKRDRQDLYKKGGLISVTSQILTVDMLQADIPTDLITGIIVLHAERISALSPEAFIVRLYREKNQLGFVKAFSDQPEQITSGLSPLRNIIKELKLRNVHMYPRFHEEVKQCVEKKTFQTIQLYQNLTDSMNEIHESIIQCITSTLSELKRSNTSLDLDDFTVENAYFRSFDAVVRRQLDSVWHKVGPKTKQLVNDLATLRRLLTYLLAYDPIAFHAYLETIVTSFTNSRPGHYQSPWLLTDAANVIFREAKRRCYTVSSTSRKPLSGRADEFAGDEEAWEALDDIEEIVGGRIAGSNSRNGTQKKWPKGIEPTLEELPKWSRLTTVLTEIEEEIRRQESQGGWDKTPGTNTVLIMTASTRTTDMISEYLSTLDPEAPPGAQGRQMMERKLRAYLWWRAKLEESQAARTRGSNVDNRSSLNQGSDEGLSEALKKKDKDKQDRAASRRRVRGAAPTSVASGSRNTTGPAPTVDPMDVDLPNEAKTIVDFLASQAAGISNPSVSEDITILTDAEELDLVTLEEEFDMNYGLLEAQRTVLVRAYSDDSDDSMLTEIRPRFIVMFDPNLEFIRRVEVYRSSSPGLPVRMYFLMYQSCCEEHKFLLGLRREKDAFTRLIQEYAKMPLYLGDTRADSSSTDSMLKTISTRFAGGRKELNQQPSRVIVDMREFRSSLPSILHASKLQVIPATLTVGDYILTPDICVERKSIPDLMSSFNSGRLYTQCELMSVHYKQPILLVEFEEHKSFSLSTTTAETKVYAKPSSKYPASKCKGGNLEKDLEPSIQSKIVLLTLTFPRVRIIWSSSPYATAEIFNDLKINNPEPDLGKAIVTGAEEDPEAGTGVNAAAEELLRCLPGITAKNVKHVMSKVRTVRELCELNLVDVQDILGVEPGKACWDFMHRGDRQRAKT